MSGQEFSKQATGFPSVFFLDSEISQKYHVEMPKPNISIPPYVRSIIGDFSQSRDIARSFFETIHEWMPIISKKRFYENFNPLCSLSPDHALVILCMDLISWLPGVQAHDGRTAPYLAAKKYYLDLELADVLSIQCLQAGILIATFELGHAIYPSAYLSVAACARYGSALGLDWRTASSRECISCSVDSEEQSRAWWAIVLLDRYVLFHHFDC